ncbi:MAG: recombinase family protein [Anaerolineales bacterium]
MPLTPAQRILIEAPLEGSLFLSGPAGAGKTTAGVERMLHLMAQGIAGGEILLLMPQRTLGEPYRDALYTPGVVAGSPPDLLTIGGLARRMVELFWPLVAEPAGFAHPDQPPTFLTLETAQYYMAHVVRPRLEEGMFTGLTIDRNRLYSQLIDNLNKAAFNGFPLHQIAPRLRSAWPVESGQTHIFDAVQVCVDAFRAFCLQHNLLDFSLQVEIFYHDLWQSAEEPGRQCRAYLRQTYRHLLADNLEENPPIVADILQDWLPDFDSALLIFDEDAGYRRFLGAAPQAMAALQESCRTRLHFEESFVTPGALLDLGDNLAYRLRLSSPEPPAPKEAPATLPAPEVLARHIHYSSEAYFYPQMLDWVCEQIAALVDEGVPPGEIVVLAPFLSDALRFALANRLEQAGIPTRSHRPSRALRDEPATLTLLTLTALAHPQWGIQPPRFDFTTTLMYSIADVDLVRAGLLAKIVYRTSGGETNLTSFENVEETMRQRITYRVGMAYEHLRRWLEDYRTQSPQPLDHFISRLFGEVLSQPGYGFHARYDAAQAAAMLVESVQKFRWATGEVLAAEGISPGEEYLHMVRDGVIAAQYLGGWQTPTPDAVFLAPAYTFLMQNRPADYQFWLDVGSQNWFARIAQPLTHPYILSREWEIARPWTDFDEVTTSSESLRRLVLGLIRRCRKAVYLGISTLNEQGYEQRGPLYRALAHTLMT